MSGATSAVRSWLAARAPLWQSMGEFAQSMQRQRRTDVDDALKTLDDYRSVARDLATARHYMPGSSLTAALTSLYANFHAIVNRSPRNTRATLLRMLRVEIPETVVSLRPQILWVVLLFVLSVGAGWWMINTYPTLIGLIASQQMIDKVEHGQLWTQGLLNVTPSSILSLRILSNNIVVSLAAFCAGLLFGLGTFYMIAMNGLMLGGVFAFTHQYGLDGRLFTFIIAHGTVELSVICLAGAAGMALGESLIRPELTSRRESFQLCASRMIKLMGLCALLLVVCGLIEGFVSPDPGFPLISRVVIGVCYWLVMLSALSGRLFGASRAQLRSDAAA